MSLMTDSLAEDTGCLSLTASLALQIRKPQILRGVMHGGEGGTSRLICLALLTTVVD